MQGEHRNSTGGGTLLLKRSCANHCVPVLTCLDVFASLEMVNILHLQESLKQIHLNPSFLFPKIHDVDKSCDSFCILTYICEGSWTNGNRGENSERRTETFTFENNFAIWLEPEKHLLSKTPHQLHTVSICTKPVWALTMTTMLWESLQVPS